MYSCYNIIQQRMDLETLVKNIKSYKYRNRDDFVNDVVLIYQNSTKYNGADHTLTKKAKEILDLSRMLLSEYDEHVQQLERNIQAAQEAALDAAETDSIVTGTSCGPADHDESSLMGLDESQGMAEVEVSSRSLQRSRMKKF